MKIKIAKSLFLSTFCFAMFISKAQTNAASPFEIKTSLSEAYQTLPLGAVKPTGWLQNQLRQNLDGFTGHLDSLAPDLILQDDIYGKDRLTKQRKSKNLGAVGEAGDWQVQFLWWNSETQSNWRDGYIRTAVLLNDKQHLQKVRSYVQKILATQDEDGYLGIYDKDLRYSFTNENGELWSKTTLLRGLIAWYEYTKDPQVLTAVQRAVDNVMANYRQDASHPFLSSKPDAGGLTHGLVFTDVLEKMHRLTGDRKYLDYLVFLYKDFSLQPLNEDSRYERLLNPQLPLKGHGVHAYEHLRSVAAAYYASGNESLKTALQSYLQKIDNTITASGAPIGDEYIGGRAANATTGYEYCSMHELMDSYISLLAKTGNAAYGDKVEKLFFNAAQGARHPEESAICYLKTDNSYALTGGKNGDTADKYQTRYRYSPVHREAAVCCVPNAGRISPAYIQNAWMKSGDTLVAALFAPCELETKIKGQKVLIKEVTNYPYENTVRFSVATTKQLRFPLKIRRPAWAKKIISSIPYTESNGFLIVDRNWRSANSLVIQFVAEPEAKTDNNNAFYFTYGPLILARAIEANEEITKRFAVANLVESKYKPANLIVYQYANDKITKDETKAPAFHTRLFNPQTGKTENVSLAPMGTTILRQVSFQKHSPAN